MIVAIIGLSLSVTALILAWLRISSIRFQIYRNYESVEEPLRQLYVDLREIVNPNNTTLSMAHNESLKITWEGVQTDVH